MKEALYGLALALQFLTRIPLPVACPWNAATCRWALRCFPLAGLVIGAALAALAILGQGLPTPLLALALLSLWVALSGGLHLDGVMDVADALGSNTPLEKRWAIMKDSQVGSFAILALLFLLAWKGMLIWGLLEAGATPWLLVAIPASARFGSLLLLRLAPLAWHEGLAWTSRRHMARHDLLLALLPLVPLFGVVSGAPLLLGLLLVFLLLYCLASVQELSGTNGDIVGAAIEGRGVWLLLAAWSWWSFVMA